MNRNVRSLVFVLIGLICLTLFQVTPMTFAQAGGNADLEERVKKLEEEVENIKNPKRTAGGVAKDIALTAAGTAGIVLGGGKVLGGLGLTSTGIGAPVGGPVATLGGMVAAGGTVAVVTSGGNLLKDAFNVLHKGTRILGWMLHNAGN